MVKSIEKCENEVDNIPGAQELAVFNADILKYVDKEPLTVEMHDDGGCEYYFLNFNPGISKDKLATMLSDGFWGKEEDFASKRIFILKQCYD